MTSGMKHGWGWLRPILEYLAFAGILLLLTDQSWKHGGLPPLAWHKAVELPLLLYLYFLLRSFIPRQRFRAVLAALPLLLLYVFFDVYYFLLGRVFRLTELQEVPEMIDVLPWHQTLAIAAIVGLPLLLVASRLRWPGWRRAVLAVSPLALLLVVMAWWPGGFLRGFSALAHPPVVWSDYRSVAVNGRLAMMLYQSAKRRDALRSLASWRDDDAYGRDQAHRLAQLEGVASRRNVHVLMLEGFIDPKRLQKLRFNRDPVHPDFRALLLEGRGSLSRSPVYGGYTAQAEFEVLCGVPALQEFGTIEFNRFSGARVHCMPDTLASIGYRTVATEGFKPEFFNARAALRGVGFDEVYFPREYAPADHGYLSVGDVAVEQYMFDGTMLTQNLDFIAKRLSEGRPLLNYVMTIYGHIPFRLDERVRPRRITIDADRPVNDDLKTIVNQIWYRSKAIADYLNGLRRIDPEAIVLVLADHLPPMPRGKSVYDELGYLPGKDDASQLTLIAAFDRGRPLAVEAFHHYDVPALVYRLLLGGRYCETETCEPRNEDELQRQYRRLMAHAVADG